MPQFGWVTKIHLLAAIRDYRKEPAEMLDRFDLDPAGADLMVVERGQQYDARPVFLAAYERAVGESITAEELPGDLTGLLAALEVKVVSRREAAAAEQLRASRQRVPGSPRKPRAAAPAARAKAPEPVVPICPTCMMQLPAGSKVCENCG